MADAFWAGGAASYRRAILRAQQELAELREKLAVADNETLRQELIEQISEIEAGIQTKPNQIRRSLF